MITILKMPRVYGNEICRLAAVLCIVIIAGALNSASAITRWSTLQAVPGADMLPGGRFVVDADIAWNVDEFSFTSPVSVQRVQLGFSEWVGMEVGYAGGLTLGMKARIMKEDVNAWYIPSLTVGLQNLYTSREGHYFKGGGNYPRNEFYVAAAKSSDWAMLRGHIGIISAATDGRRGDGINPFVGFEKYFGQGMYVTVEAQRRASDLLLSFFAVYRPVPDRLEFNLGIIDAPGLGWRGEPKIFRPTVRAGIRAQLGSGFNGLDGLTGVEDRIDRQRELIRTLNRRIDTVFVETRWNADRIHELSDLPADGRREERARVIDDMTRLRNLYDQEPYDPELVKNMLEEIEARYDHYSPHLRVIITDPEADPRLRRLAVSLIGEMGDKAAANILISILNRFEEPALKIETMIALSKLRETRARPVLSRLRNDPDSGVSFTAREVYSRLFGTEDEDAGPLSIPVAEEEPIGDTVPERRLGR